MDTPIKTVKTNSKTSTQVHKWARWLHVYISMFSLMLILFFSFTGLTLNHPEWTLGGKVTEKTAQGTLPTNWRTGSTVDWLLVSEILKKQYGVKGNVADRRLEGEEGFIGFNGPGYQADVTIDPKTGNFKLQSSSQGWVAWINDLHKGRDTSGSWKWVIDASAIFLIVVSATGLLILLFLKKIKAKALWVAGLGLLLMGLLMRLA